MFKRTSSKAVQVSRVCASSGAAAGGEQTSVALVLSGSGVYDGSEITEAVSALIHLDQAGVKTTMFAPDMEQMHVVNHLTGEEMPEKRNVLVESARIARGQVRALSELDGQDHDAVLFVGGFGAAKNLSDFAVKGAGMMVRADVKAVIRGFNNLERPVGLCCISPVLAANVLGEKSVVLTVGKECREGDEMWPYAGTAEACTAMGAKHVDIHTPVEAVVDEDQQVVTVPAYMANTTPAVVFKAVGEMVKEVLALVERNKSLGK